MIHSAHSLPLIPYLAAVMSEASPPRDLAKVHQAKAGPEDPRDLDVEVELVEEVWGDDVVHGELHAEAEPVGRDHAPHPVVLHALQENPKRVWLGHLSRLDALAVLSVREVLGEEQHENSDQDVHGPWDAH